MNASDSDRPVFRQLADQIREAIDRGVYAHGTKLPTDADLAEELGTTRALVSNALMLLTSDGVVTKTRKGTVVSVLESKINRDANARYTKSFRESQAPDGTPARGAFDAELRSLGLVPRTDLTVSRVVPPDHVAETLGVPARQVLVVSRARVMFAVTASGAEVPVQIATSYLPGDLAFDTVLEEKDTGTGGLISRLADFGYEQKSVTETIEVRRPTEAEARALTLTEDQRVYTITHVGYTAEGRAVEVAEHLLPVHLWALRYSWAL
jgi:GntR family transcriptional regulator